MPVDQQKIEDRIVIAVKRAKRTGATLAVNVRRHRTLAGSHGKPARADESDEVTIFDSVGFAIEDFSTLRYVREISRGRAVATLDLIPAPTDPKDIFSVIAPLPTLMATC